MEVEHSRLLKFFNVQRSKMSEQHKIRIEIINPTNIESEVPIEQNLRDPASIKNDSSLSKDGVEGENKMADIGAKDDSTFVPVFTSKKEEAVFTKGDVKLQKISDSQRLNPQIFDNPLYSEIQSEVIQPQAIRLAEDDGQRADDKDEKKNAEDKKSKSRIPMMRLKQAAEKMKRDRRGSEDTKEQEVPVNQPRRSSIPRRRRKSYKSPPPPPNKSSNVEIQGNQEQTQYDFVNNIDETKTKDNNSDEEIPPEEEFDKIFDEIIHTVDTLQMHDVNVDLLPLIDNIEDPVSLEHCFEEIINDYEENKVKPIDVKEIKTKIPLVKQKSLQEEQFSKKLDRRLSFKEISIDGSDEDVKTNVKARVKSKENIAKINGKAGKLEEMKLKYKNIMNEDEQEQKRSIKDSLKKQNELQKEAQRKESKVLKRDSQGKAQPFITISRNANNSDKNNKSNESKEILKKASEDSKNKNQSTVDKIRIKTPVLKEQKITSKDDVKIVTSVSKDRKLTSQAKNLNPEGRNPVTKYENKTVAPVLKDQKLYSKDELKRDQKPDSKDEIREDIETFNDLAEKTNKTEFISEFQEIPESTKMVISIINIDPQKYSEKKKQNSLLENCLPVEKRHVETEKRETGSDSLLNKFEPANTERSSEEKKLKAQTIIGGKVSKLSSKFTSNEPSTTVQPKKDIIHEIPKKKSILSKIALFNKDKNDQKNESNKSKEHNIETKKSYENTETKTDIDVPQNDHVEEFKSLDKTENTVNSPVDIRQLTKLEEDNKKYSSENQQFLKPESLPIEIPNSKLELHSNDAVTPPNTPQITLVLEAAQDTTGTLNKASNLLHKGNNNNTEKQVPYALYYVDKRGHFPDEEEDKIANSHINRDHSTPTILIQNDSMKKPLGKGDEIEILELVDDFEKETQDQTANSENELIQVPAKQIFDREHMKEESDENSFSIKGKVSKIIHRISSIDETAKKAPKREPIIEVPVKKSVSSKIALFERQASTTPTQPKQIKTFVEDQQKIGDEPRIIGEVLKAQPPRLSTADTAANGNIEDTDQDDFMNERQDRNIVHKTIEYEAKVVEVQEIPMENTVEVVFSLNSEDNDSQIEHSVKEVESDEVFVKNDLYKPYIFRNNTQNVIYNELRETMEVKPKFKETIFPPSPRDVLQDKNKTAIPKQEMEVIASRIEERLKRIQSVNEDSNLRKSKSVAELDLGDALKGKVHQLIVRMNSVEQLELEKRSTINIKEQPRKRSVSEKIALFERKLVPVEMETTPTNPIKAPPTPIPNNPAPDNSTPSISELKYQARIDELKAAKIKYGKMEEMLFVPLNNGAEMPVLALGTALLDPILLPHVVSAAIDLGFRAIDTAFIYGNEKEIGEAIRQKIEDGTVRREDLFITGKLWSTFHRQDLVEGACRASLDKLGLEYFDLYLVHNPMSFKEGASPLPKIANVLQFSEADYLNAWFGMEGLVSKGLAKSIGVSNFNSEQILKVVEKARIKPVVNQVECHPYLNQQRLDQFCADRDIKLMCFGVLGSSGTPKEYRANTSAVIDDPLVAVMAAGLGISPAQLLLRYQIECGHAVVTKCSSAAHLWDNLQALGGQLSMAEVDALHALNKNKRTYDFRGMGDTHRNYPFKIPY